MSIFIPRKFFALVATVFFISGFPDGHVDAQNLGSSRWQGAWTSPDRYLFQAEMTLTVANNGSVDGSIKWTLLRSPRGSEQSKIGLTAMEHVKGTYDSSAKLVTMTGYRKDDPYTIIGVDVYRLLLADRGNAIVGVTSANGTWEGRFSARKVQRELSSGSLEGNYDLYPLENPGGALVNTLSITDHRGSDFKVGGESSSGNWGAWKGTGKTNGREGYYEWQFDAGQSGRTTITISSDGCLRGHVVGSGLDWWYLAIPR